MELLPKEVEQAGQANAEGVGGKIVPIAAAASGKMLLAQLHQTCHTNLLPSRQDFLLYFYKIHKNKFLFGTRNRSV